MLPPRLTDPVYAALLRVRRFLDDHWLIRWFVVPLLFMGACVFLLALVLPIFGPGDAVQLAVAYLVLAFAVVVVGLVVERVAIYAYRRATGRR